MSGAPRWVFADADGHAHTLADGVTGAATLITMCGLVVPTAAPVVATPPSLDVCHSCARCAVFSVGPPLFPPEATEI